MKDEDSASRDSKCRAHAIRVGARGERERREPMLAATRLYANPTNPI